MMKIKTLTMTLALAVLPLTGQAHMNDMNDAAMSEVHGQALSIVRDKGRSFSFNSGTNTMSYSKGSLLDVDVSGTVFGYGLTVTDLGWDRDRGFSLSWTTP
ncbi:MAG TPA: DUF6160 family protein [Candidatus Acidoferrales bacterium]|nr:DUF6160 family protein [Candidatus Acidoferrales bacterium]